MILKATRDSALLMRTSRNVRKLIVGERNLELVNLSKVTNMEINKDYSMTFQTLT